jgi:hypothetical protein
MEKRYSFTLFLTSALDRVGGQRHTLAATLYSLCRRLGGPQGRSGRVQKILPPPGFNPRTVQPVANRYTDWDVYVNHGLQVGLYVKTVNKSLIYNSSRFSNLYIAVKRIKICKPNIARYTFQSLSTIFRHWGT